MTLTEEITLHGAGMSSEKTSQELVEFMKQINDLDEILNFDVEYEQEKVLFEDLITADSPPPKSFDRCIMKTIEDGLDKDFFSWLKVK